ncbi:hypothetical protein ACFE04_005936 [Oxalis oulophora]
MRHIEFYNSIVDKEGIDGEKDALKAYKAALTENDQTAEETESNEVSSALVERVDAMLQNLEKEIDDVDAKIGDGWRLLDRDYDGKVTPEEMEGGRPRTYQQSAQRCRSGIQLLFSDIKLINGKILVEDIVKLSRKEDQDDNTTEETQT